MNQGFKLRAKLVAQRFWQPTSACMTCMPGSLANVVSPAHWELALRTGVITAALVLLLSFTGLGRIFRNRYGNAAAVGCLTALGDLYAHEEHYGVFHVEALVTGVVSACLALAGNYLLEDRARRVRRAWARLVH